MIFRNKKVKKEKKETQDIKAIINDALTRIIKCKTKRTYQGELAFITKTIEDYIAISYVPKDVHIKEKLEQIFGYISQLENMEEFKSNNKDVSNTVKKCVEQLRKNIYNG